MRKIVSVLIILTMLSTFALAATRIELYIDDTIATVDGEKVSIDADNANVTPIIFDERTLLPVRFIAENLGMTVAWDEPTQTVTLSGNKIITLTIDNPIAYIDDEPQTLDSVPIIHEDRTYLPIRFISEALDKTVDWNEFDRKVTIRSHPTAYEPIEIFNGLTFTPIFPDGLSNSSFATIDYADGEMFDDGGIVYGSVNQPDFNVLGEFGKDFLDRMSADTFPPMFENAVVKNSKIIGQERFGIVTADLGLDIGTTDNLMYLTYDKEEELFVFASVIGTDQAAMDKLNALVSKYK